MISSVARGSVLATGLKQGLISVSIVGGGSLVEPGSRFGTMTNFEKHLGSSQFKHFASDKFAMMMHCLSLLWAMIWAYCPSWTHHAIASSVWGLSLNCSNIFGALFLLGKTLSSPKCSVLNRSNSSHICALAFLPIFIAFCLFITLWWFGSV